MASRHRSEVSVVTFQQAQGENLMVKSILFWLLAICLLIATPADAQQKIKVARIGFLGSSPAFRVQQFVDAFRQGLRELGYIEGQNATIEYRYADGKFDRLPKLAAELVGLKVDVIFAQAAPAIRAAKEATKTIPIVFETLGDPVSGGFVTSLAKPGGNLTGVGGLAPELSGKRLELLKEIVPRLTRVAVLANPNNPQLVAVLRETETAAFGLGLRLQVSEIRDTGMLDEAFAAITKGRAEALTVFPDPMISGEMKRIVNFAAKNRLPVAYGASGIVEIGGLLAYGPSQSEMFRRAAYYVEKILKGTKPSDLPVEQPTKFELVINLKTAKQIDVRIPPNVLARADKVIR
jgi:putative tryptophan/tyrosine transport system substrate-binding protein